MVRSRRSQQSSWSLVDPIMSVARKVMNLIVGKRRPPPPRRRRRRDEPSQLRIEYYRDRSKSPLRLEYHRERSTSLLQLEYHRDRSPSPFPRRTRSERTDNERDRYSFRSERRYSRERENRYPGGRDRGSQLGSKRGQEVARSQRRSQRDRESRRSSITSRDDRSQRKPAKDAPRSQKRSQRDREGRHSLPAARDDRAERRRSREVSSSRDRYGPERRSQYNAPADGSLRSRESRTREESLSRRQSHGEQERQEHPVVMTGAPDDRTQLRKSLPPPAARHQVDGEIPSSAAGAEGGRQPLAPTRLAQSDIGRTQEGSPLPEFDHEKQNIQCFSVAIEDNASDINPTREPSLLRRRPGFERVIHIPTGITTGSQVGKGPDLRAPDFTATNPGALLPTIDTQECVICREPRQLSEFPILSVTTACDHPPRTCFNCIQRQIKTNMQSRHWKDVHCPECNEMLEYQDVERLASPTSLERYDRFSFQEAINDNPDIFECVAGCGNVQYHVSGSAYPIVMCAKCGTRACYTHRTEWHKDMTCEEYDQYILDPDNFKSRAQREEEEAQLREEAQLQEEAERIQRERQDAYDRRVADELAELEQALAQDNAAQDNEAERQQPVDGRRQRERHRERDRDRERQSQRERDRDRERQRQRERDREREHQRRARQKEVDKKRRAAAVKSKRDDAASLATIGRISKPCPGCKRPIEKNDGCQHMTCSQCRYQFCWKCSTRWSSAHFDCDS